MSCLIQLRLSKKSVYRKQIGIKKSRNDLFFLQTENKMYVKRHGSHRENRGVASFLRNRSLRYHRTATKTISQNIPSFFNIFQCVDRFIDTLKGQLEAVL